jgi:hypothetical protein
MMIKLRHQEEQKAPGQTGGRGEKLARRQRGADRKQPVQQYREGFLFLLSSREREREREKNGLKRGRGSHRKPGHIIYRHNGESGAYTQGPSSME